MTNISQNFGILHHIILENREKISLNGVKDVNSFDEKQITVLTEMGSLTIKGTALHINKFDTKNGELNVSGKVNDLSYSNKKNNQLNFIEKIFK